MVRQRITERGEKALVGYLTELEIMYNALEGNARQKLIQAELNGVECALIFLGIKVEGVNAPYQSLEELEENS